MKKMVSTNVLLTGKQCLIFNVPFSANLAVGIRLLISSHKYTTITSQGTLHVAFVCLEIFLKISNSCKNIYIVEIHMDIDFIWFFEIIILALIKLLNQTRLIAINSFHVSLILKILFPFNFYLHRRRQKQV